MAFDFPSAPAVGDEFAAGGATYQWTGDTWDLGSAAVSTDYVLKAGDTMTGDLNIVAPGKLIAQGTDPATMGSTRIAGGGASQMGLVEWFKPDGLRGAYMGWGSATRIQLQLENGITAFDVNGGINFGTVAVSDQNNCSRHLKLWHNTADDNKGFGLNITSGRMNFTVDSTSNMHCFMCGDTQAYMIDTAGSTGNMISGTSFIDRSLVDDPTLADFIEGQDVRRDAGGQGMSRRGVNLGKLLTHALKEIRELRAEVDQLKTARPAGRR